MTTTLYVRTASVLSLLFAVGHTLGGRMAWSPVGETDVLSAMRTFRFDAEGVSRTYLDFYVGFGLVLSVYLVLQAVLLWQVGGLATVDRSQARPFIVTWLIGGVAATILTWTFIMPVPVYFWAAIDLSLTLALLAGR
jgi:hypothetical protein